jgi:HEPN domain-containing protein
VQKWVDQACYDLDTARAMLDSGRYVYVVFCCQQAVEKALKALIIHHTKEFPPRIHSLPRLAEAAGITFEKEQLDFIAELSVYYMQTRYPEENEALARTTTAERAAAALTSTEKVMKWLLSMIA